MAQGPDPLRKELAFFRRRLIKQERELQDLSKRADRRERLRETLEARMRARRTQRRSDEIKSQMGKRLMGSQDSGGSKSRSASRGPTVPRPPEYPPPTPPNFTCRSHPTYKDRCHRDADYGLTPQKYKTPEIRQHQRGSGNPPRCHETPTGT